MSPPSAAAAPASPASGGRTAQTGAPARRSPGPRRISGPAAPARPATGPQRFERPVPTRAPSPAPFTQHVTRVVDHSLLDRLIRGRAWIGLIGFALIGIVAMQVTLLKLNAGIGRSIQRVTVLQRQSSSLAAEVAGLSAAQRVQTQATGLGMVYAPPDDVRYLRVTPGDAARAATAFVAPSANAISSSTPAVSTSIPAVSTSTAAVSTSTPAVSTSTPAVSTSTPAGSTSTPAGSTSTPAVSTSTPAVSTSTPAGSGGQVSGGSTGP